MKILWQKKRDVERRGSRSPSYEREQDISSASDPRLRRLMAAKMREREEDEDDRDRVKRRRHIQEPQVMEEESEEEEEQDDVDVQGIKKEKIVKQESDEDSDSDSESDSDDSDLDEDAIARRRELMRQRALYKAQAGNVQEEMMRKEDEKSEDESDSDEETEEEETDSEAEDGARLKPVFVRAKDRLTIQEREREEAKARQLEKEATRAAEDRRRQTLRIVEDEVRKATMAERATDNDMLGFDEVVTDDENDEVEYEAWKVRELKRLKRDRDEAERLAKEEAEIDRLRNMTEEQRRAELRQNPKEITNEKSKGSYKFMQKYYHRGAFYLDKDDDVYKRDFTAATLEDKFNKSVLPKVMQVKNFGRSGRTKYTHLVDQDTTEPDNVWAIDTQGNRKFMTKHAGGMKQEFEKPRRKKNY